MERRGTNRREKGDFPKKKDGFQKDGFLLRWVGSRRRRRGEGAGWIAVLPMTPQLRRGKKRCCISLLFCWIMNMRFNLRLLLLQLPVAASSASFVQDWGKTAWLIASS